MDAGRRRAEAEHALPSAWLCEYWEFKLMPAWFFQSRSDGMLT